MGYLNLHGNKERYIDYVSPAFLPEGWTKELDPVSFSLTFRVYDTLVCYTNGLSSVLRFPPGIDEEDKIAILSVIRHAERLTRIKGEEEAERRERENRKSVKDALAKWQKANKGEW
jgi:hypothetical protein